MGVFSGYGIGGGAYTAFYGVTVGTTQTTLASTTPLYSCESQISTDGAKDDSGVTTFTMEQIQADKAFFDFIKTNAPAATGTVPEDINLEDATQLLGAQAGGTLMCQGVKGPQIVGGTDNGKRLYWLGLTRISASSGSVNFSSGTYVKPTLVSVAQKITQDLTVPANVAKNFQSTTTGTTVTVSAATEAYGKWDVA